MQGYKYDFSGMKKQSDFGNEYNFLAVSENGAFNVCSYIVKIRGRGKIYGYYNYQEARYIEEKA
jgi:hypothetical protein